MKNYINKSAKRAISLALAFVLLIGTLFTANVGVNIKAGAETEGTDPYAGWTIKYWDGTPLAGFWAAETEGEYAGKYLITNAAQLNYACAVAGGANTSGKSFVIDPTIDAFIMQPKEVVEELGIAAFVEASGAEETRELFEDKFAAIGKTPVNWINSANATFAGNFDGSGVPIYGIYADGTGTYSNGTAAASGNGNVGFFPSLDGGDKAYSGGTTDEDGLEVTKLVVKNGYFKSFRRVGILTGGAWWVNGSGDGVYGHSNVNSCVFGNCYVLGQNYIGGSNSLYTAATDVSKGIGEMGLLGGDMGHDPMKLSNTLVYGNKTEYDFYESDGNGGYKVKETTPDAFNRLFKSNTNNDVAEGSIKYCVILDAVVNGLKANSTDYCESVYSDTSTDYSTVTNVFDNESVKGTYGRYAMAGLGWETNWWAVEGEYPTPIMPDNYISGDAKCYKGSGSAEDPYLIYCVGQLNQMVSEGGKHDGKCSYYKVANGVDAIYINKAESLEEIKALNGSGTYNNWIHGTTAFNGNFDGNGVTIYGMISKASSGSEYVGFVPKISTTEAAATIKNVNFVGAYITSYNSAAVVSSQVSSWGDNGDLKPTAYITNVTVRESYIKAANKGDTSVTTVTNEDGTTTDYNTHGATAAGILSTNGVTPDHITIANCLYDGSSCELYDGNSTTSRSYAAAGIVSVQSGGNEITVDNCVSIGANAIPMVSAANYDYSNRYVNSAHEFNTVYGNIPDGFDTSIYAECATCYDIGDKNTFTMLDMPLLNWGGAWTLETLADGRSIPMPKKSDETVESYASQLVNQNGGNGANQPNNERVGGYTRGTYGMYEEFLGSGTEEDPYIISDALGLARAIACGGKDITTKLYYKLACDIDVGASWLNTQTVAGKYVYVPFEGTLDGDGHTIYNLYSVSEGKQQGLIPIIADGAKIKNLHIRDSYICSGGEDDEYTPGAFFGSYNGKVGKVYIEGCSYESDTEGTVRFIVSDLSRSETTNSYSACKNNGEIKYRYYESCYWDSTAGALGGTFTDDKREEYKDYVPTPENADFYGEENVANPVWYKGGEDDCKPQLVNRAKAMTEVDISGYGDNDYDTNDIASLRKRLLGNKAYANVYGDVNRDGKTNLGDLAILRRQLVDTYNMHADGFWRNAALGNIVIYYGENNNYDFARKLELALEDTFGKDVKKVVVGEGLNVSWGSSSGGLYVHKNDIYYDVTNGNYYDLSVNETTGAVTPNGPFTVADNPEYAKYALDGNCQIVVGNIPSTDYATNSINFVKTDTAEACDQYGITYDKANSVVWLQGGSFTAVEQATIDFINESNPDSSYVYTTNGAVALDTKKMATTVDGTTYYYAWGDEFNSSSLHKDSWNFDGMHNETSEGENSNFANLETAFPEDIEKLYEIIDDVDDETDDGKLKIWRGYYADAENANAKWGYKWLGTLADKGIAAENDEENELYTSRPNLFGGNVEADDTYATAGKICTNKSMLVKQGYLEMKASYPQDGHAFACWWLLGHNGTLDNRTLSNSLYGKVFKLNNIAAYNGGDSTNAWDGTNALDSRYPNTFKYQLPQSSYEIDIVELMQGGANAEFSYNTANFTFHKFYRNGIYTNTDGAKAIKFIDWDYATTGIKNPNNVSNNVHYNVTFTNGIKVGKLSGDVTEADGSKTLSEFLYNTKMDGGNNWAYEYYNPENYNGEMIGYKDSTEHFSKTPGTVAVEGGKEYIFGVKWDVSSDSTAYYKFTVYDVEAGKTISTVNVKDITYDEDKSGGYDTLLSHLSDLESDQATANQYMYMLIDNTYYTALNGSVYGTDDMLTQNNGSDEVATMEIDYVRVYQQKRDIVTPDTEEFNNGNHFGY